MVLQRAPQSSRLWGTAQPGAIVTAVLDGSITVRVLTADSGDWSISLPPQNASIDRTITITDGTDKVQLTNVAFGDIYIASGQSNIEFVLSDSFEGNASIKDAGNYPYLRLFAVAKATSLTPITNTTNRWLDPMASSWQVSSSNSTDGPEWVYYSALGFYFGRELHKMVNTNGNIIPIGVIMTCWGGVKAETWTSAEGLTKCKNNTNSSTAPLAPAAAPELHPISLFGRHSSYKSKMYELSTVTADPDPSPYTPTVLYNAMLYPITPMAVRGVIWYQGESDVDDPVTYACRFPALINDWRQSFNNYDLWFGFVLVAGYKEGGNPDWPLLRDAQLSGLSLPMTHAVTAQDLGDQTNVAQGNIHPRNKTMLGYRLARAALNDLYTHNITSVGPSVTEIIWPLEVAPTQTIILRFSSASAANQGLILRDTSQCDLCCASMDGSAFTVGTSDGKTLRAAVHVDANAFVVLVTVTGIPTGVRITSLQHGYEAFQQCALYNNVNLPHLPVNVTRS